MPHVHAPPQAAPVAAVPTVLLLPQPKQPPLLQRSFPPVGLAAAVAVHCDENDCEPIERRKLMRVALVVVVVGMLMTHQWCVVRTSLGDELGATTTMMHHRGDRRWLSRKARSPWPDRHHLLDQPVAMDASGQLMATPAVCEKILDWTHLRRLSWQRPWRRRHHAADDEHSSAAPLAADNRRRLAAVSCVAASADAPTGRPLVDRVSSPTTPTLGVRAHHLQQASALVCCC